jgi:NADH:flavin oxidoreductase / NADH oxidase family
MTRSRGGAARLANQLMAEYYTQRSSAGLLISEGTTISEEANGWNESPGIYTGEMTEGWKHTTNAVHEKGAVIFLQLWHTGRASHSSFHGGKPAVAPSAIKLNEPDIHTPTGKQPLEVPRALETSEIPRVVEDYRRAAQGSRLDANHPKSGVLIPCNFTACRDKCHSPRRVGRDLDGLECVVWHRREQRRKHQLRCLSRKTTTT